MKLRHLAILLSLHDVSDYKLLLSISRYSLICGALSALQEHLFTKIFLYLTLSTTCLTS